MRNKLLKTQSFLLCVFIGFLILISQFAEAVPTKSDVNTAGQYYLQADDKAQTASTKGELLEAKRDAATVRLNSNFGEMEENFRDFIISTGFANVPGQLISWIDQLVKETDHFNLTQMWAEASNAVNEHLTELYRLDMIRWEKWRTYKSKLDDYNGTNSGNQMESLDPPENLHYPNAVSVWWSCFSNKQGGSCLLKYNTPVGARDGCKVTCGSSNDPFASKCSGGCGKDFYKCHEKQTKKHRVVYCSRHIIYRKYGSGMSFSGKSIGICGEPYRVCTKTYGVHAYNAVYKTQYGYNAGTYRSGLKSSVDAHAGLHLWGKESPLPVSVNGPNGVGLDSTKYDESPKCPTCIDNSKHCPDASTNHKDGQANNNGIDNGNQGDVNDNGVGNTENAVCLDDDCNVTITQFNSFEHELVTCDKCGVKYHKCNDADVYAHAYVACKHPNCPRKRGTGSSNLYWKRRCQGNPPNTQFSCLDGRPHQF